jgi:acyl-CoA synthetase (AMP-forming)/AMP-acid ligase II
MLANIRGMGSAMEAGPADVFVSWLPLYHDMGLIGAWLGSLYFAAPLVVMSPLTFLVRPEQWLWAIHRHRATLSHRRISASGFACTKSRTIAGLDLSLSADGGQWLGGSLAGYHPSFRGALHQVWLPAKRWHQSTVWPRMPWVSLSTAGTAPDHRSH